MIISSEARHQQWDVGWFEPRKLSKRQLYCFMKKSRRENQCGIFHESASLVCEMRFLVIQSLVNFLHMSLFFGCSIQIDMLLKCFCWWLKLGVLVLSWSRFPCWSSLVLKFPIIIWVHSCAVLTTLQYSIDSFRQKSFDSGLLCWFDKHKKPIYNTVCIFWIEFFIIYSWQDLYKCL